MDIKIKCQHCGEILSVSEEKIGKKGKCNQCQNIVDISKESEVVDSQTLEQEKELEEVKQNPRKKKLFFAFIGIALFSFVYYHFLYIPPNACELHRVQMTEKNPDFMASVDWGDVPLEWGRTIEKFAPNCSFNTSVEFLCKKCEGFYLSNQIPSGPEGRPPSSYDEREE